jgi:hypothetical protein
LLDFLVVCFRVGNGFSSLSDGSISGSQSYQTGKRGIAGRKPWFFGCEGLVCNLECLKLSKLNFWIFGAFCLDRRRRCSKL